MSAASLDAHLDALVSSGDGALEPVAETLRRLAAAAAAVADLVAQGAFSPAPAPGERQLANSSGANGSGRELDAGADDLFLGAARAAPVALYASTELARPVLLDRQGAVALAVEPLNGSADVDLPVALGSIFSILPLPAGSADDPELPFRQLGRSQLAAGFFAYGAQLSLTLTTGSGTHGFAFSRRTGSFVQTRENLAIPPRASEIAVDASNIRHWNEAVRLYVDDCLDGSDGPRERDFTLRWSGSLAADVLRVLHRGGIFLAPADARKGHGRGVLQLVCSANPLAFLAEQAVGAATDAVHPLLDLLPEGIKQRTPLVLGSKREVERIARYHTEPSHIAERAPLFGHRGLFRP